MDDGKRIWQARERKAARLDTATGGWLDDHPGHPLGVGMPSGSPLREDGETHSNAWRRLLRADPCAYCGGPGGSVDHIVPRASRRQGVERWTNLVGACERCNGHKRDRPLLMFLRIRRVSAPRGR